MQDQNLAAKLHKDHRYILGVEAGVCKVVLRDDAGPMDMLNATFEAYARSQIAPSRMPSSQSQARASRDWQCASELGFIAGLMLGVIHLHALQIKQVAHSSQLPMKAGNALPAKMLCDDCQAALPGAAESVAGDACCRAHTSQYPC